MVGTAFLSAEPGAEPFIAVGDTVKAGDTLLIVEAMKVMNPITAPEGGMVKKIMVADAQPVEFDQPLVDHRLRPSSEDREAADRQPRRDRAPDPSRLP